MSASTQARSPCRAAASPGGAPPAPGSARRSRASAGGLFAGLLALLAACGGSSSPDATSPPAVDSEVRAFVDASRPTSPNASFPGAPERSLATRLWYAARAPAGAAACRGSRCALIVLAHGFGGSTVRFDAFARWLAAAGYIVAAPSFPLTNDQAPGGHRTAVGDLVNQPADVSFVIDRLLATAEGGADPLSGRIDPERVGVVGHSLGGATVIALTRLGCCADPRVGVAALVAPAAALLEPLLHEKPRAEGPPTLVVNGSDDPAISPASSRAFFEAIEPPRLFVEIPGAGHSDLIENVGTPAAFIEPTEQASRAFFDAYLGGDDGALAEAVENLRASGVTVLGP